MKKVLIIAYYWPPAGGPGVQRWLKFVKYLPEFNVQPIVYIPENPSYPILDYNLEKEIAAETIILKKSIFEPYGIASLFSKKNTKTISSGIIPNEKKQSFIQKLLLAIRGNLFIPDARVFWVKPSVKYLEKYISENNIDIIITTGPPHSMHLIGLQLKEKLEVKWFADFRDPWTNIGYHSSLKLTNYAHQKHIKQEKLVLNSADTIIVTSKTTKDEFTELTNKPIEVITNGFDVEAIEIEELDQKFTLAHIGSFLSDRNPLILWESLKELVAEDERFGRYFELKLIGKVSEDILETIKSFDLFSYVNNLGYLFHNEAIRQQKTSQILLLIEINSEETKSIIPGKLFEYMASERPIIALGPVNSDFEEIITITNTGYFFAYDKKHQLKTQILTYFELFLKNNLRVSPINLEQYSRRNLTEKLAVLIHSKN